MKYLIFLFTSLLLLSCSDEQMTNPIISPIDEATVGVKSKTFYPSLESNQILSIEDFEYTDGQLQKKVYFSENRVLISHYELFSYDNNGKLLYKLNYHNNTNSPTGFILLDSTTYSYSGNVFISEKITFPYANYYEKYNYEYDGKYIIKKTKYHNEELESVIAYEYRNGKLQKETLYDKTENVIYIDKYVYEEKRLIEILRYSNNGELLTKINYNYNTEGKIILENVEVIAMYLSIHSHIIRYEY